MSQPLPIQAIKYDPFYRQFRSLRWALRFDVRYRCARLRDLVDSLQLNVSEASVLDVGFGSGRLLASFPTNGPLVGAEISQSAVYMAREEPEFAGRDARFVRIAEGEYGGLPAGPFDVALSSHVLEHVPDDGRMLSAIWDRLRPGGLFFAFVPIEEPDYNPDHIRNYSLDSVTDLIRKAGFRVVHAEGSMQINGHLWKYITIPSRRRWPVVKPIVDFLRLATLSLLPYRSIRTLDRALSHWGVGPRQALVLAVKPSTAVRKPKRDQSD